ncbi:MAG: acyltransferase [Parasphingorhabdus sp.]|uniref:acyltransferase family protein n=1 Tax=Parasphingorhabdus sp. TaxID=2709688 RepID=UPI00300153D9
METENIGNDAAKLIERNPEPRDALLDGFRAYAVGLVIFGHAIAYRFADQFESWGIFGHQIRRLSGPLANLGVYVFFTISGYIITNLLLREEKRRGQISLQAFYLRRTFRILPPLLAYLIVVFLLSKSGVIASPVNELPRALFTCNLLECEWYTGHTWTLAVEEQFYLAWPVIFLFTTKRIRSHFSVIGLISLISTYAVLGWTFHSNALSFACITGGVCIALWPNWREFLTDRCGTFLWIFAGILAVLGPFILGNWLSGLIMPLLVLILIFGSYGLSWVRPFLVARPVQWIGAISYSLYLWQQLFLGREAIGPAVTLLLLPVVALLSMYLIERPFIRLSHRLSRSIATSSLTRISKIGG